MFGMATGWLTRSRYRWLLPALNLTGCALFVMLRPPVPAEYLAEVDAVRRTGGLVINSSVSGMVACRQLTPGTSGTAAKPRASSFSRSSTRQRWQ